MNNSLAHNIRIAVSNPCKVFKHLGGKGWFKWIPDEVYLRLCYRGAFGKKLNLDNPQTFNEKLQWLKLYDRNPKYIELVDKNTAKKYVSGLLGDAYTIPTLGLWNSFDEIDFNALPAQFVLKCTHDSGNVCVCKDRAEANIESFRKKLSTSLNRNFYWVAREWPYKNVPRQIIAEKYMTNDLETEEFTDYKFFCFNGYADCVMICQGRNTGETKFYFFDQNWDLKRINKRGAAAPEGFTIPKPECMDEMFRIAAELSKGFPFVRIDLYQSCGKIYFGEFTFYPDGGYDTNLLPETDMYFGKLVDLNLVDNN